MPAWWQRGTIDRAVARTKQEPWTRRKSRKNAKESNQMRPSVSLAFQLLMRHCEERSDEAIQRLAALPLGFFHPLAMTPTYGPGEARSPMCRAAAHRGSIASPPGERYAHFGLHQAAVGLATEIPAPGSWMTDRTVSIPSHLFRFSFASFAANAVHRNPRHNPKSARAQTGARS